MKPIRSIFDGPAALLRRTRRLAARGAGALLLIAVSAHALADYVKFPYRYSIMPPLYFGDSLPPVPRDAPLGTVLKTAWQNPEIDGQTTCAIQKNVTVTGTPVPGDPMTFQTNVRGIGVRFSITGGWNNYFKEAPEAETLPPTMSRKQQRGPYAHYTRAELVVTGPVGSGRLTDLPSMTATYSGSCIVTETATQYLRSGTVVAASSCSVTTSSLAVTLPAVSGTALPAVGSTSGNTAFHLGLNCSAGTNVKLTLTDATNESNTSTTLSPAQGSTATGVGLQILREGTPVAYGPASATPGNRNQWSAGTAAGGLMAIPLTAQYIRTGSVLQPGSVSGLATFTMSYQ